MLYSRGTFLVSDFKRTFPEDHPESLAVFELCEAAGLPCSVDPTLVNALRAQPPRSLPDFNAEAAEEDYQISCLLMVLIAVVMPKLSTQSQSFYRGSIDAHLNNAHCMAKAINEIAGALFSLAGQGDIHDRMKEFLALASGSLLRLGQSQGDRSSHPNIESTYILLDKLVSASPWLTVDLLESCFPYVLLRSAYHCVYKQEEWQAASA